MMHSKTRLAGLSLALAVGACVSSASAAVLESVSVFATSPSGASNPDSVTLGGGSLFVSYAGGTDARTGAGFSTIVQYGLSGAVQKTYSIAGSVDGLKYNPVSNLVFALQNQDANSTLSLINPATGTVSGPLRFASPPYTYGSASTRGYDDVAFLNGSVYLSYTNPTGTSDPVVQRLVSGNAPSGTLSTADVVSAGQTGATVPDTDSLKAKPNGDLVLTDSSGGRFLTISNVGTATQGVTATAISFNGSAVTSLDDVLYPSATAGTLFVADRNNQRVLALGVTGLDANTPFVSLDASNQLVTVASNGVATTFLGSVASPHGLEFLPSTAVPEPASLTGLSSGMLGMFALRRRKSRSSR